MYGQLWNKDFMYIVQQHHEYRTNAVGLATKYTDTNLQGKRSAKTTQESNSYHTLLKIWERVVDRRMRQCTTIHESQFGFMPGRSTTDAIFILKQTLRNTERAEEHQSNIYRPRKSTRQHTQGGDMEIIKGRKCAGKVN